MWLAADLNVPTPADQTGSWLIFAGGVIAVLGSIAVAFLNRPRNPPADNAGGGNSIGERVAVTESKVGGLEVAVEDLEDTVEIVDRRVIRLELQRETDNERADDHHRRIERLEQWIKPRDGDER